MNQSIPGLSASGEENRETEAPSVPRHGRGAEVASSARGHRGGAGKARAAAQGEGGDGGLGAQARRSVVMRALDVHTWALGHGRVGHVACEIDRGWITTLCDMWVAGYSLQADVPRRICPICRRRLKACTLRERHARPE